MALFLLPAVRGSKNERGTRTGVAHSVIARAGRGVGPASRPPEPGCCCLCGEAAGSGCGRGGPEEARQLPGDGDSRDVVVLAARLHRRVEVVQALLAAVGDLQDVVGLSFLAVGERRADTRFAAGRGTTPARCPCGSFSDAALPNPA